MHPAGLSHFARLLILAYAVLGKSFTRPSLDLSPSAAHSSPLLDGHQADRLISFGSVLQERSPDDFMSHLGFGWAQHFQEFASWLPAGTATGILESFYKGMLHNAQYVWPLAIPSNTLVVKQGALVLRLHCDRKTIPWTMVKDIARVLLEATELGFTGRYEGKFVYLGAIGIATTIDVSLKVNTLQTVP